ncbi:MAG TPA: Rieske 2Fe-2S domain-containing protein [Terriglobales bacterium]|jgi:cytochrome b6-f complex iron-sulfur subunit|nr:Rieske 2Fe-2S domain-containing protein [Terriglobales bacterium]
MADGQSKPAGVLGHLPPWPRKPLNNSVIAMEQAYRQRKGLPGLNDAEVEALKAGVPMPWEGGGGGGAAAPVAATAAAAEVSAPASPAAVAVAEPPSGASAGMTDTVKALLASYPKWNKSSVAAEQARRKRKGLPLLSDAEMAALAGEAPAAAAAAPVAAAPAAMAATAAPARPAVAARPAAPAGPPPVTRQGAAVRYVGTPAVGTSKAAAAGGVATAGPEDTDIDRVRRRFVWSCVAAFLGAWFIAFFRFFLPRTLFEPSTVFKIGAPSDYALGIDEKWLQKYRIWVDRRPDRLFIIYARCTHLGCTPDWKPAEHKFKCPCHGSGYDDEGVNFEGPAPRPMDRAHIEIAPDGQILVDTSHLYSWPKGQPSQFNDPGAFLPV